MNGTKPSFPNAIRGAAARRAPANARLRPVMLARQLLGGLDEALQRWELALLRQTALMVSIGRGGARSTSLTPRGSCSIKELTTRPTPRLFLAPAHRRRSARCACLPRLRRPRYAESASCGSAAGSATATISLKRRASTASARGCRPKPQAEALQERHRDGRMPSSELKDRLPRQFHEVEVMLCDDVQRV